MAHPPSTPSAEGCSRRELLRAAGMTVVGGSAGLVAACGGGGGKLAPGRRHEMDARLLNAILDLENVSVAAYATGLELLRGPARRSAKTFLEHEREHARALGAIIGDLGERPRHPRSAAEYARGFPSLRTERDVLRFVVDLENALVRAYGEALPKLSDPRLRRTVGSIVSVEAEHMSVLLGLRGQPQVPEAFVTGKS